MLDSPLSERFERAAGALEYRCYFLDSRGHFIGRREFEAESDAEAMMWAEALQLSHPASCGFEVWQRGRHVQTRLGTR